MTADVYSSFSICLAVICLIWYVIIVFLSLLGAAVLKVKNTRCYQAPVHHEGVTILRPLKGIDTELELCLTSSFLQNYPKFEIIFCLESDQDPAYKVANSLIEQFPHVDATVLVGAQHFGPNPKVNNLAKGYAQAKYDIVWVLDSNVWVTPGAMARSVDALYQNPRIKLVHHLPLCLAVSPGFDSNTIGAKLDEMFLLTSHSKFYQAINTVALAPCVMGKSNMYRRSDLDAAVPFISSGGQRATNATGTRTPIRAAPGTGITYFASFIAEDNMIADALWNAGGRTTLTCDSVIQPLRQVSFTGYYFRRVRWLRVRRYMVLAATLLEPTTESILCGIFGTFAVSVLILPGLALWNWLYFVFHMLIWCAVDYWSFHNLISFGNVEQSSNTPYFASPYYSPSGRGLRSLKSWLPVWIMREVLALPIWITAMCGAKIYWRDRPFRILADLTAEEITK